MTGALNTFVLDTLYFTEINSEWGGRLGINACVINIWYT